MPVTLPVINEFSNYSFSVSLDGSTYRFEFIYNERSKQWTMNVLDVDRVPIVYGIKLVLNYNLFDEYSYLELPPGEIYAIDTTGKEIEFDRTNIGESLKLIYILESEIDTI